MCFLNAKEHIEISLLGFFWQIMKKKICFSHFFCLEVSSKIWMHSAQKQVIYSFIWKYGFWWVSLMVGPQTQSENKEFTLQVICSQRQAEP